MADIRLEGALEQLFSFSMAKRAPGGRSFSIHPLVHIWARERLDWKYQTMIATEVIQLFGAKLASIHARYEFEGKIVSHVATCVENAVNYDVLRPLI